MTVKDERVGVGDLLMHRGVSRRQFLKFCGFMAATLALPATATREIASALTATTRLPVVWLEFQDCTGDTESFLRAGNRSDPLVSGATDPSITELVLEVLSVDYHETIMAPVGTMAEKSRADAIRDYDGQYICVVEGSIPAGQNGAYCVIGGRSALSIVQEVTSHARATIALGTCAWEGGLAAATPNPTGAVGVRQAVPGLAPLIHLPGCPANVVNLVATIVHVITYGTLPPVDERARPVFAFDDEIHERCPRRMYYRSDMFVEAWGDEGHRKGWCLKKMGCKGPETHHNCPTVKWNDGECWPVAAGHGCVGCAEPHFWDSMTPFYSEEGEEDDD